MMTKIFKLIFAVLTSAMLLIACGDDETPCIQSIWYLDADADSLGNPNSAIAACTQPEGYVSNQNDADDTTPFSVPDNVWQGEKIVFSKADSADWTLAANQDKLTDSVIITRQNERGIFNIAVEDEFDRDQRESPKGTEWAYGNTTEGISNLIFQSWNNLHAQNPRGLLGKDLVLHLLADDIYLDVRFLSWTAGRNGGGFSYQRTTK